jgi:histidyl-tRNA synthetase
MPIKNQIPFVIVIGEEEVKTGKLKIKELGNRKRNRS